MYGKDLPSGKLKNIPHHGTENNLLVQNECRWKMILENVGFSTWGEKISWGGNQLLLHSPKHANDVLQQKGDHELHKRKDPKRSMSSFQQNSPLPQPENVQSPLPSPGIAEREAQSNERSPPVRALKVEVGPDNFGTAKSPTLHFLQVLKKVSETRGLIKSAASDKLKWS